jgi:hypothetical protein
MNKSKSMYVNILFSPKMFDDMLITPQNAFSILTLSAFNDMRDDSDFGRISFSGSERVDIENIVLAMLKEYEEQQGSLNALVEYDREPIVGSGEEISFKIRFKQLHIYAEPIEGYVNITMPEGWQAKYRRAVHIAKPRDVMPVSMPYKEYYTTSDLDVTVIPDNNILPLNKLQVTVELTNSPIPFVIPITLIG